MNIETLQAAERVSAWYRNRRVVNAAHAHAAALPITHSIPGADARAANDAPLAGTHRPPTTPLRDAAPR
jgi:hypothetical protein